MERILRPERFSLSPDEENSAQEWKHWFKTFQNFISSVEIREADKMKILTNFLSPSVYEYICECHTYNEAINILKNIYVKPVNEVFARHKLKIRRQETGETIDRYVESLKRLSKECNFKAVTAEMNRDELIRDTFIDGLLSTQIRQRLLENYSLTLEEAVTQARALESAQFQTEHYNSSSFLNATLKNGTSSSVTQNKNPEPEIAPETTIAAVSLKCYFCGHQKHRRTECPAKDAICKGCGIKGHYQKVCKRKSYSYPKTSQTSMHFSNCVASLPSSLSKAVIPISINGLQAFALIDTGSSASFIDESIVRKLKLPVQSCFGEEVSMASTSLRSKVKGQCKINLSLQGYSYENTSVSILPNLCSDVIIGHDVLKRHSSVQVQFGGTEPPLNICSVAAANVEPAQLFFNLTPDCKPISVKSRRFSLLDTKFIENEIQQLLREGIIEESISPWRAQVLVVASENHKRRMVVDYSQTINRFTELDAFPLPRIDDIVNQVASYNVFSSLDLRSAYHQVRIRDEDKPYTAFEACGKLYQFTRIPFGVRNGVPAFQRTLSKIISDEGLEGVFVYLDDVTICGHTQAEHDRNLEKFMRAVSKYNLTLNKEKSTFSVKTIHLLGYVISNKSITPDPDRLKPLNDLPLPTNVTSLRRALGMFSHYSQFIPKFSEKVRCLNSSSFPLNLQARTAFECLKSDIQKATLSSISNESVIMVETDASDHAIGATLSADNRPVAFFSRSLSTSELHHSSVEKEAYAIVEALRKWRHYLLGRHFRLITDQRSVSFMFNSNHSGKIKNEKITRWRLELSCFTYEIVYRPGKENKAADTLSRICSSIGGNLSKLKSLHEVLCHPGETRMYHWVRSKNLAYSLEEIRRVTSTCRVCAEVKPRFHKHEGILVKATQPFERLNIDFKGPLPSSSRNHYLLIVVDEFSRFPFAYPCRDMSASTIISKLQELFCMFGTPAYIHSDRGSSFMSQELKSYLYSLGIASSRTTPYNPRGNGQAERYVGVVWKSIQLSLKSKNLDISKWESVYHEALHSIRSLLCTTINTTPHERFFAFTRRSSNGIATPSWLMNPGPVLMRRPVRKSKFEPLVQEVLLLEGNPEYSHVRLPDGRETTISTRDLAPIGSTIEESFSENPTSVYNQDEEEISPAPTSNTADAPASLPPSPSQQYEGTKQTTLPTEATSLATDPRKSNRIRQPPSYLKDYIS